MENPNFSKTGDKCPQTGKWISLEDKSSSVFLNKDDLMPPYKGRSVSWLFKHE